MRSKGHEMVPAQEFADWLNQRLEYWERRAAGRGTGPGCANSDRGPIFHLLQEIGWPANESGARRLYRYRKCVMESFRKTPRGRTLKSGIRGTYVTLTVSEYPRDLVEDALHHASVPFSELYPVIAQAEELELEPARWCPGCRASHTPIDGLCPFCEWRLGPPTGQALKGQLVGKVA